MMISGQLNYTTTAEGAPEPRPPRLQMKPSGATRGDVDGGWWPWPEDPATQFPALVSALRAWVGPVSRVSYHLGTWGVIARKVPIDGQVVRFEGSRTTDPHTVTVIGSDSRRVSLLVVPPGVLGGVARAVLRSAAGSDSTASVGDILASNGVPLGVRPRAPVVSGPRVAEPAAEERWEGEGGHVPNPAEQTPDPTTGGVGIPRTARRTQRTAGRTTELGRGRCQAMEGRS
jgi:hypothetical protein